jgi:hypothetical protein
VKRQHSEAKLYDLSKTDAASGGKSNPREVEIKQFKHLYKPDLNHAYAISDLVELFTCHSASTMQLA